MFGNMKLYNDLSNCKTKEEIEKTLKWYNERIKQTEEYAAFLRSFNLKGLVAEIGVDNAFFSVLPYLRHYYKIVSVLENAEELKNRGFKNVYAGKIEGNYIVNDNRCLNDKKVDTYLIGLKNEDEINYGIKKHFEGKDVIFGTCGKEDDPNFKKQIEKLYEIKNIIGDFNNCGFAKTKNCSHIGYKPRHK